MKEIFEENNKKYFKENELIQLWKNQHPIMYWWFALTSLSLCSVYIMLLTKF